MGRTFQRQFPSVQRQVAALGERIRKARLRRRMTGVLFAERLGVSRDTLNRLEKGDAAIALGTYARALRILGLDQDLDVVARDDELGRKLQDLRLPLARTRGSQRSPASSPASSTSHKGERNGSGG